MLFCCQKQGKSEAKRRKQLASTTSSKRQNNMEDGNDSAVYETVAHNRPEFVPFDYSAANYSSFSGEISELNEIVTRTETPICTIFF